MSQPPTPVDYLDIHELVALTGYSVATIWRLKKAEKIPYYQPGGSGTKVTFPPDALARVDASPNQPLVPEEETTERLPGPMPQWMSSAQQTNKH
jgi:predicted DNA-binding transcriptional regulator AlpA